ncbi:MT-A70-domain-containing protein [Alternaria rosae]|uniref:MT-A70-domain-containing protein n=1 Tax=Alternaria rosae TaxID=1187941 RepID=UPI001E8EF2B5|nr:MT-A70-domain-containing protein [Alternaria rosae]KAH6861163.1 MT-A70-domain-containing protein [Alternaria rosae]
MASSNPIIYQNAEADVILIDIPTSIAAAQGDRSGVLLSTAPLEAPIESKEDYRPKAKKHRANETQAQGTVTTQHVNHRSLPPVTVAEASQHEFHSLHLDDLRYKVLAEHALRKIRAQVPGPWCAQRKLMTLESVRGKDVAMDVDQISEKELESRMKEWASWSESKEDDTAFNLQQMMASLGATSEVAEPATVAPKWIMSSCPARETASNTRVAETVSPDIGAQTDPWTGAFHNPNHHSLSLSIAQNTSQPAQLGPEYRFTVPPRSTFFLSDSTASEAFRTSFRELTDEFTLPRHFDLVLLDPPWPNRSAKRKGAYEQVGGMPYLKKMLLSMDIDSYLEHNALVGVWITNKEALREHVLGSGGLFEIWNVGLIEEWIWIKTTTKGEPMFDIDSAMRKPYEILLLGRAAPNSWTTMTHAPTVKRRVIAAVPDIHSRKPCLKQLLEPFLADPTDYSALEVFSRYLVSGWTSWGNEVLKYNWDGYWAPARSTVASTK